MGDVSTKGPSTSLIYPEPDMQKPKSREDQIRARPSPWRREPNGTLYCPFVTLIFDIFRKISQRVG